MFLIPRRRASFDSAELGGIGHGENSGAEDGPSVIGGWERAVAEFSGVPYAASVGSGRRGMSLILEFLGIREGDEIVVPSYTLGELMPLVRESGAIPVPADIDPDTWNLSPESVAQRISGRTRAILAVHLFGNPSGIGSLAELASSRNIPLIEDCAHALGATSCGKAAGSFGYAGFFSFEMTKPVNTFGGGMVVSRDGGLIDFIKSRTADDIEDSGPVAGKIRATLTEQRLFSTGLSFPFLYALATPSFRPIMERIYRRSFHAPPRNLRYLASQARMGMAGLRTLPARLLVRAERARLLRSLLSPKVVSQRVSAECSPTHYFFVVQLPCDPCAIRKRLLVRGIDAGIGGEIADDCAALLGFGDCPNVGHVYAHALALPMWDDISVASLERVARALNSLLR